MSLLKIFSSCLCDENGVFTIDREDDEPAIEIFKAPLSTKGSFLYASCDFRNPAVFPEFENLLRRVKDISALLGDIGAMQLIVHSPTSIILGASQVAERMIGEKTSKFYKEHEEKHPQHLSSGLKIKKICWKSNADNLHTEKSASLLHLDIFHISFNVIFSPDTIIEGILKYAEGIHQVLSIPIEKPPKKGFTTHSHPGYLPISKPDSDTISPVHHVLPAATTARSVVKAAPFQIILPTLLPGISAVQTSASTTARAAAGQSATKEHPPARAADHVSLPSVNAAQKSAAATAMPIAEAALPASAADQATANRKIPGIAYPVLMIGGPSSDKPRAKQYAPGPKKHSPSALGQAGHLPSIKEDR